MSARNLKLTGLDEIFTTEEMRQDDKRERVMELTPEELQPFQNHPFHVQNDAELQKLVESIKEYGILAPLIARPKEDGYELISGHRRKVAAEIVGVDKLPVLVRDMTDDEAIILMVDSNIQRENLLPSEKAFAYKMKLEALKHQGKSTLSQVATKSGKADTTSIIGEAAGESRDQVFRYIRLTELIPPLLQMADERKIAFSPAVELSYLTKQEQAELWDMIKQQDCTPSLSQAVKMKKLSQIGRLTADVIYATMTEEKPNQKEQIRIPTEKLRQYFPKHYTAEQMEKALLKLLEERQRKLQKNKALER